MSKENTLFRLVGENTHITQVETDTFELIAKVLKQAIISKALETISVDTQGIIGEDQYFLLHSGIATLDCDIESVEDMADELARHRASELVQPGSKIRYYKNLEAFTCEITQNRVYLLRHSTIDKAMRYALENIGDITVIYNDEVIVFGGYVDSRPYWYNCDTDSILTISLDGISDNIRAEEKVANFN